MLLVLLMTSPSFNHWTVGVGVPLARQTSRMLSFSRTPISLGSSDPEILGGTKRELLVLAQSYEYHDSIQLTRQEYVIIFCGASFFNLVSRKGWELFPQRLRLCMCIYLVWWGGSSCVPCPPRWRLHTCKCRCQKVVTVQSAVCFLLRRCASPETLSSLKKRWSSNVCKLLHPVTGM